jgi:hypothetical protein
MAIAMAAEAWSVESAPAPDRTALSSFESAAKKEGKSVRIVRRFRLGQGWAWVAIVEGFGDENSAQSAGKRLAKETAMAVTIVKEGARSAAKTESPPTVAASAPRPETARAWADAVVAAHGGKDGGALELSRAAAVHFQFDRELEGEGKRLVASHEYWREGPNRRVEVDVTGGVDSLAVATPNGAWVAANGQVVQRDIGVVVNQIDAFAPEVALGVVLDVTTLLGSGDGLVVLEGAESGIRIGRGEDPSLPGLAFVDLDPATGRLALVRYVTAGGPVVFRCSGWASAGEGVLYPTELSLERPDGRFEAVHVRTLAVAEHAPPGSFVAPTTP